jgi:hypothetical protein
MWIFYICSVDVGYATILPPQIVKTRTTYIMYIRYLVFSPSQYQTFHAISQPQKPFVSAMPRMRHRVMNVGYFVRLDLRLGAVKIFSFVQVQLHVTCETPAGTQIGSSDVEGFIVAQLFDSESIIPFMHTNIPSTKYWLHVSCRIFIVVVSSCVFRKYSIFMIQ